MIGRVVAFVYGFASYLVFVLSSVYAVAFVGNYLVPKSIDVGPESSLAQSILIDVVLLGVFAVQHTPWLVQPSSAGGRTSSRRPASAAPMC